MSKVPRMKVSQAFLHENVDRVGVVRVGSTVDPKQRASSYQAEGYRGTMYIAPTSNMYYAEKRLLDAAGDTRHNIQRQSNAPESSGYVYMIQGQKRSK